VEFITHLRFRETRAKAFIQLGTRSNIVILGVSGNGGVCHWQVLESLQSCGSGNEQISEETKFSECMALN